MDALKLAVIITALAPAIASAQSDLAFGGYVKGFVFQQVTDPFATDRAGSRLQLNLSGGDGEPASFYAAVDFEIDSRLLRQTGSLERGKVFATHPVELYANISTGPFEIRLGQQLIFWGRSDWINPTDVITPWDFGNMASEIEDYRPAPVAARVNWYIVDELMLDLVWTPFFSPTRIPITPPTTIAGLPVATDEQLPDHHPENSEVGLRLSHAVSAWAFDWSIATYRGFEKTPSYAVTPLFADPPMPPAPIGFTFRSRHHPIWMVGGDFAKAIDAFVIKGEAALKVGDDTDGTDPTIQNSRVEYVLGINYTFSESISFGGQYIGQTLFDYGRKKERQALTELGGSAPPFVARPTKHEISLRLDAKLFDTVGTQVLGLYNLTYQDFFGLGFVWWEIADALKLFVGAVVFGGTDDTTPYGRQSDGSRAFVELKYSF